MRTYDYVDLHKIQSMYKGLHIETLRSNFKKIMTERGLKSGDLGEICNISPNTGTTFIQGGSKKLDLFHIMLFAAFIDVDVRYILRG